MADQRVANPMRICDATTLTQGLAIDSGGAASVAVTKINSTTAVAGNGVTGNGSLRVTIASDNTPFAVKTDQTTHGTTDLVAADITKIAGNAVGTGASGIIKVALTDAAGSSVTKGQTTMTGSLPVTIASDQTALTVSVGTPTNPAWDITNVTTPVNLAAGASGDADSADLPTKHLRQLVISGSVAFKAVLQTMANGVATKKAVFIGGPGQPVIFTPAHSNFIVVGGATAGLDAFRVSLTNLDTSETADFYVAYAYADD